MVKSARRRNAKKTVGRKKRGTKGYRRKTMRKRQKGGVDKDRVHSLPSAQERLSDGDDDSLSSLELATHNTTGGRSGFLDSEVGIALGEQPMNKAEYTIRKQGDSWLVTININGTEETYVVPDDILGKVGRRRETAVG